MVNVGDEILDIINGLTGVAVARTEYLNGCISIGVRAKKPNKDGEE
jgi:hypothetical protein